MYLYLYLNIFTIFFPLVLSFDKRVAFYRNWRFLLPAMLVTGAFFITWDAIFTNAGIWGFNPEYLMGINLFGLPVEEIMFFITVPYACVFIYETLNVYFPENYIEPAAGYITLALVFGLVAVAVFSLPRLYTSITFFFLTAMLAIHYSFFGLRLLGRFYRMYLVHLIPFFVINGFLTALPIVWYNNNHNLSIRLYTIPVEDTLYSMLLLLMTITLYEGLRRRWEVRQQKRSLSLGKPKQTPLKIV
jgi:lycopene cyclase domain-containing protein